jgi:hypothetical protein
MRRIALHALAGLVLSLLLTTAPAGAAMPVAAAAKVDLAARAAESLILVQGTQQQIQTKRRQIAARQAELRRMQERQRRLREQRARERAQHGEAVAARRNELHRTLGNIEAFYTVDWASLNPDQRRAAITDRERRIDAAMSAFHRDRGDLNRTLDQSLRAIDGELDRLPRDIARQERLITTEQETLQALQR